MELVALPSSRLTTIRKVICASCNASDNVYCTLLAHSAVHGAMAGYTGFTVGPVNGRHAYIPFRVSFFDSKQISYLPLNHI